METVKIYKNKELIDNNLNTVILPKLRNDFIAKLENALMFMSYKDLNMWHSESKNQVNLKTFDGSWLLDMSLNDNNNDCFTYSPYGDLQVTPDMYPKMNIKLMNLNGEVGYLSKFRFLTAEEKRHLVKYRFIVSHKMAFLDYGKQNWWTNEEGFGIQKFVKDKELSYMPLIPVPLKQGHYFNKNDVIDYVKKELQNNDSYYSFAFKAYHMALQLSMTYEYEWSCYIKESPDKLGIRIPIHPNSSKDVFMLRDKPEGKSRKKAIVNFVKEHYRNISGYNEEERIILIKKHLRGELKFNWRGLEVNIIPSLYDLSKIKTTKKILNIN